MGQFLKKAAVLQHLNLMQTPGGKMSFISPFPSGITSYISYLVLGKMILSK